MRYLLLAVAVDLLLALGCDTPPLVKCKVTPESYSQHIYCHCVYECETMRSEVKVVSDGFCNPLCEEIE
jgi:hypothetical protein